MTISKIKRLKSVSRIIPVLISSTLILTISTSLASAYSTPVERPIESLETINFKTMQWGLAALNADKISAKNIDGEGSIVAVLDTGIDYDIENLKNNLLPGFSTVYKKAMEPTGNYDEVGHGSHVASIIAGNGLYNQPSGLAPKSKILPIQVLSSQGGSDQQVADGIEYAINARVSVINLSLGGEVNPFSEATPITCEAIVKAYQADIPVIVAAGNSGSRGNPLNQPASCPHAISVAAVDRNLNSAPFSSFDESVFISAPGVEIVASIPNQDGKSNVASWSGTSMATPFITASVALYKELHPTATVDQIKSALQQASLDIGTPGFDSYTGHGLLNLAKLFGLTPDSQSKIKSSIKRFIPPTIEAISFKKNQLYIYFKKESSLLSNKSEVILNYNDGTQSIISLSNRSGKKIVNDVKTPEKILSVFLKIVDKKSEIYYSLPYTDIIDENPVTTQPIKPDITSFKASFKGDDLLLEYKMNDYLDKKLTLWVFNDDIGVFLDKEFPASKTGKTVVKLDDKRLLEHALSLSLSSVNSMNFLLSPKYLIAVSKESSEGKSYITIKASFLCIFHSEICKSAKAKLYKGDKLIASAPIDTIGDGVIEVKGDPKSVYVTIGNFKSRVLV